MLAGCFLVIVGLVVNKFYSADIEGGSISDQPIPTWLGRAVFIAVGIMFIVGGIALMPVW